MCVIRQSNNCVTRQPSCSVQLCKKPRNQVIGTMDFSSYMGPGDKNLPMSEVSGYQPANRIGETVQNAFVDPYEFESMKNDQLKISEVTGNATADDKVIEYKPMFHEWATVQPGMVCLARKKKMAHFRQYLAAETAVPVIACASCLPMASEKDYFFAGVARSKSVRSVDDGIGPNVDEFFTVSLGGTVTMLNTADTPISCGDLIEWTLCANPKPQNKNKTGPRRVSIKIASVSSPKIIGRALSFAKKGETFDCLLKP